MGNTTITLLSFILTMPLTSTIIAQNSMFNQKNDNYLQ